MSPIHTLQHDLLAVGGGEDPLRNIWPSDFLRRSASPQVVDDGGWVRGGAETYIRRFVIANVHARQELLLKACVPVSLAAPVESHLEEWVRRRQLVASAGISTPTLFAYGEGMLLEEYIPYTLSDAARVAENKSSLIDGLSQWAAILIAHRFAPIEAFRDLRSRGTDVVVIDFGEDLGPPNQNASSEQLIARQLQDELRRLGLQPNCE